MFSRLLATTVIAAAALTSVDPMAARNGQPSLSVPQAPIGHSQPRAPPFAPRSAAEQVEQDRMSAVDAEQKKSDQELDWKLGICRCGIASRQSNPGKGQGILEADTRG